MAKCKFNSEYAYILNNINDQMSETINIKDFIKNKELQNEIKNKKKFLVCKEKHELIKYESKIKKCHFKHKINNPMTDWHKEWQSYFEQIEIQIGNNIADVLIDDKIIEFQHSYISKQDVEERNLNAINNNKVLNWIIDCNNTIEVNQIGNIFMIYFYNETWKFDHFKCHDFIYLNIDDKIYKINPNEVKSNMIDVIEYKTKNEFINSLKHNLNIWSEELIEQCTLYHNQRGAGCGKTYESIQLMNKDERFKHKQLFIYLTKAHTAKFVIYNELLDQYKDKKLLNLKIDEDYNKDYNKDGKQFKIPYYNQETDLDCQIIIGTIDSFMYAIGNKDCKDNNDYFQGIVKSIRNGYVDVSTNGFFKYSGNYIKLNKRCLIIIDEAQDLGPEYIEAVCSIMRNTYIDAYTIGDKLQSIWGEHNIHTFLEDDNNELPHIKIIKNTGINHVMRFHNCQFKDFVNDIVCFEKHNLPPITKICNNPICKYKHEDLIKPYNIFEMECIYANEKDETKVEKLIQKIIGYMNDEINKYNYLPNNFMFIFPILSKNFLASRLEAKIQEFWIEKFNDIDYQNNVLKKNNYWNKRINNNKYYKYIVLHKSDEGKSIDLRESENSTKILSIHASKGNGCEVVFLFGLTQNTLQLFSIDECNLQYDSLVHVALTRQKKSLYIGIENTGDNISKRFEKYIVVNPDIKPNIDKIKTSIKYNRIIDHTINTELQFKNIFTKYEYFNELEYLIPENSDNKNIVDWGHHLIRYCVFYYQLLVNIINNETIKDEDGKSQFMTILNKISKLDITKEYHNNYYKKINEIEKTNKFPILSFKSDSKTKYSKYESLFMNFIINIKTKLNNMSEKNLPILCPLESVILLHMIQLHDNGKYSDITVMDVYSLIYYFDECSNTISKYHVDCKCLCKYNFIEVNNNEENDKKYLDIKKSINNHYVKLELVNSLYKNYKEYIDKNFNDSKFEYNLFHSVRLFDDDKDFKISKKFELIAQSKNYVIDFIITPQLNKLNYNQIILKGIFNNFLLKNVCCEHENNCQRYLNKKIYTCILSLDSIQPIFINFNIDNDCLILKKSIKEYIFNEFNQNHKLLFYFYNYCKKNKPDTKNSIEYTYDELVKESNSRLNSKIPKYIENYFYDTNEKIKKCNKDKNKITEIMLKFNEIDTFIESINEYLYDAINDYIKNNNDEVIDF